MINKDGYHPTNNQNTFAMTKSKQNVVRIVLFTSIVWVLIDAFLILYVSDCSSLASYSNCVACELRLEKLELELVEQRRQYAQLAKERPLEEEEEEEEEESDSKSDYDEKLKMKNERLHKIHKLKEKEKTEQADDEDNSQFEEVSRSSFGNIEWFKEDFSNAPTNPPHWPGENGKAVVIPDELKEESKNRFSENQFNIVASDIMALNRTVPDQRSNSCRDREYPVDLPNTSIIIVHHNEGNTTLLRGLTSIVNKTPLRYLKEIILVDDKSENRDYLLEPLDKFVKTLPVKVIVIRNKERLGLMRSRLVGAEAATGDTMTFLDAHIECTNGWLPPLLYEIKKNRKSIPNPIIDVISDENFQYIAGSETTIGGFDEKFVFTWNPVTKRENIRRGYDLSLPMRTPVMAGGLFTIDRKYFYEIGAYDEGMDIWGAENLEMSFRVWMCGGTVLILPCSHVGHVFRKKTPYSFPGGTNKVIFRNNRRLVDVWTDEYATYFHHILPDLRTVEAGDLSKRFELRKKLNCKSFRWYLDNVYPEAPVPKDSFHLGAIQNTGLKFCLDTLNRKQGEDCGASYCHGKGGNQLFEFSRNHNIVTGGSCLDTQGNPGVVKMNKCVKGLRSQQWDYDDTNQLFRNRHTSSCLAISETNNNVVITINCDTTNKSQKWIFTDPIYLESDNS